MDELAPPLGRPANGIRWTARIVGTLFVGIFLALFIPEWVQKGILPIDSDRMPSMIFLFLSFVGLIMAWRWEGAGGVLALGSIIVFAILGLQLGPKPGGTILIGGICALPACLFLLYWWLARRQSRPTTKKSGAA